MLTLFDHETPRGIGRFLGGHTVIRAKERGWDTLTNGVLLAEAEGGWLRGLSYRGQEYPIPTESYFSQNSVVVLSTPQWPVVRLHTAKIAAAVNAATPGSYVEVQIP